MTLFGDVFPDDIWSELLGRPSLPDSNTTTAVLAFPFSGWAETRTFSTSSSHPNIADLDAPGTTLTFNLTGSSSEALSDFMPNPQSHIEPRTG